jgi:alkyl sulfatase BDS1-like metallo-beta-lactamase superfamily hydrolase
MAYGGSKFRADGATAATQAACRRMARELPFSDSEDFELAKRGYIAGLTSLTTRDKSGRVVFDLKRFRFMEERAPAPETVNPSLWRQGQLLNFAGLFKVTERLYQVRNSDLANMGIIKGETGWIVIDALTCVETARAALDLVNKHLGPRPVSAVVLTHSHVDHFGGVRGLAGEADVRSGRVSLVAPKGFFEEAVSENVMAGGAMNRRASYMYGALLPVGPKGCVGCGLGVAAATGAVTIMEPSHLISRTGETMCIDGVDFVFQMAPRSEAPAEMLFYLPQMKALCVAGDASHTMHDLLTLRGAKVRDARAWSGYLDEAVQLFGSEVEIVFGQHHWPRWGAAAALNFLKKQRDLYRYIHDQTLRLANQGYGPAEIAEILTLPDTLNKEWFNRGYYGSLNHNVKAVYQQYLGWFDGNPASLHRLPPAQEAARYVEAMGGREAALARAREAFGKGDYRWAATLGNHLVFANPNDRTAREFQASVLEQLGYQAESASWRNIYLTGAMELRNGVDRSRPGLGAADDDVIRALPASMFFDYVAVHVNGPRAAGKTLNFNVALTDTGERFLLCLENGVLHNYPGKRKFDAAATLRLSRTSLHAILSGAADFVEEMKSGRIEAAGDVGAFQELIDVLDRFQFWFDIVTPNPPPD